MFSNGRKSREMGRNFVVDASIDVNGESSHVGRNSKLESFLSEGRGSC